MVSVLLVSDSGTSTGFGRIADNVGIRLKQRGIDIFAASLAYDGLLPPTIDGQPLPYHVATLQVKRSMNQWVDEVVKLNNAIHPDIIMVIQDAPYGEAIRNAPIDWSQTKLIIITPVDGIPIEPNWIKLLGEADGALTISEFGVDAYREAGVQVELCRPGINPNDFYELSAQQKLELRAKMGLPPDSFIQGTMSQNQGRKDIPDMLRGFFEFAKDKPKAFYLLDMDEVSPAGWNIGHLCEQQGWDKSRLIFRADCQRLGVTELRDRYNLLDAHVVLAHREGYGLPLVEAMACGVVSIAMDYCSGREIVGDGKGLLIKTIDYTTISTWGGAMDYFPDIPDFVSQMNEIYHSPAKRQVIADKGKTWSRQQTWDLAADNVHKMIMDVMSPKPVQLPLMPEPYNMSDTEPKSSYRTEINGKPVDVIEMGLIEKPDVGKEKGVYPTEIDGVPVKVIDVSQPNNGESPEIIILQEGD